MLSLDGFAPIPTPLRRAFLAIGNFDGVHAGHRRLVDEIIRRARNSSRRAIIVTFDPHPAAVLRPELAPTPLLWTERKVELLRSAGVDEVAIFQTGNWLLDLSPREFFDRVIVEQFHASGIVEGPDFRFGRGREGTTTRLATWCGEAGIDFSVVEPNVIDGVVVSSSAIRALINEGNVAAAARLLGRPHRLRGEVVEGAGRGAGLGFPTANLAKIEVLIPSNGVYAGTAFVNEGADRRSRPAAIHIGPNATFGESIRSVEAHILNFQGNLRGQTIELDLIERIRSSRKFDSTTDLLDQIARDVAATRAIAGDILPK